MLNLIDRLLALAFFGAFFASFICPFIWDEKRLLGHPGTHPYKWGYYTGMGLCSAPFWFWVSVNASWNAVIAELFLALVYVPVGIFVVKRRRWAAVAGTLLSWNPILWVINGLYFANRWREFSAESNGRSDKPAPENPQPSSAPSAPPPL